MILFSLLGYDMWRCNLATTSKAILAEQRRLRPPVDQLFTLQTRRSLAALAGWRMPHLCIEATKTKHNDPGLPATTEVLMGSGLADVESICVRADVEAPYLPAYKASFLELNKLAQCRLRVLSIRQVRLIAIDCH